MNCGGGTIAVELMVDSTSTAIVAVVMGLFSVLDALLGGPVFVLLSVERDN